MTRSFAPVPPAIAATLLFAACVNLTPEWAGHKDASDKDRSASPDLTTGGSGGSAGPDAAIGGSGGSAAAGGTATGGTGGLATTGGTGGLATTGGNSGTATGGAAGNVALDAEAMADATSSEDGGIDVPFSGDTNLPVDQGTGGTGTGGARTGGTGGTRTGGARTGGTGGTRTGGARTGGTGGTGTGGATTGGIGGTATGGAGGTVAVDAGTKADATSSGDGGIDVSLSGDTSLPSDLGNGGFDVAETGGFDVAETAGFDVAETGGSDVAETGDSSVAETGSFDGAGTGGSDGTGTGGAGGTGGTGTGGATASMIISIDFVGGGPAGNTGTVAMDPNEVAGVKPASHWNSAVGSASSLQPLAWADGTPTSSARVDWSATSTWSAYFFPEAAAGDQRMMNGYLDPRDSSATVSVTGLSSPMSSGYDVYVYCYGDIHPADTRTYQYTIGSMTHLVTQVGLGLDYSYPGLTQAFDPDGGVGDAGGGGQGDYVVFRNVTGAAFTLTATPAGSLNGVNRAPVNGIQIVYPSGS